MRRETVVGLALAALIVVGGFATAIRTSEDVRASCERGNTIRQQVNDRAAPIRRSLVVLIEAREGGGSIAVSEVAAQAARKEAARKEAAQLQRELNGITTIPLVDCEQAVRKPWPL